MATKTITDASFAEVVTNADQVVLVDFWATWCGPCKTLAPALEELSDELAGEVVIGKVDVEESPASAAQFGIGGVPTFILFKNGIAVATKVGPMPKGQIRDFIKQAL